MNVVHVVPYMAAAAGGPPVVVRKLADYAATIGAEAHVLSTSALMDGADQQMFSGAAERMTIIEGQSRLLRPTTRQQIRRLVERSSIVHLHTMWSPLCALAAWYCRAANVPYVLSPHGMLDPYSTSVKSVRKAIYWRLVDRRVAEQAWAVHYTTREEGELAKRNLKLAGNPRIVGLGADTPPSDPILLGREFLDAHPQLAARKILLFLGRVHPKKGVERALAAMKIIEAEHEVCSLVIVGAGEPSYEAALRVQAQHMGVSAFFLGPLHGRAKWRAICAADAFVLSSHQENFAIAVAEALHAGCPALVSRHVNIAGDVEAAGAGYVHDLTTAACDIASQFLRLVRDQNLRATMSERAVRLANSDYRWPTFCERMYAVYDEAVAASKACRDAN